MVVVPWIQGWLWSALLLVHSGMATAAPVWICRVRGSWDTGMAIVPSRGRSSFVMMILGCKLLLLHCSFSQWCTCYVHVKCMPVWGGPGLLHWVQKAWCHTTSACSSVCLCRTFMANFVFFVHCASFTKEQLHWHVYHCPSGWHGQTQQCWAFSSIAFNGGWFGSVQDFETGDFVPTIRYTQ